MSLPSPKSPDQSDKSRKYDRQLRLWGEHGQKLLENAKICLVNATGLGCEVLKSLVLPGIGGFTIADVGTVTESDLSVNFFVDATYIGQSRALACTQLLQELNPDVLGDYVEESVDYILESRPAFFADFNIVIASNLNEKTLLNLSKCLWENNVPFIYCRSLGMIGSIRLQIKEHLVVEVHPEPKRFDLRLEHNFPGLKTHFQETAITNKVPWLLVLNKYYQLWKSDNEGRTPSNYKEKNELRQRIRADMPDEHENYEEAISAVNTAFDGGKVPGNVRAIFEDDACINLHKDRDPFWIMSKALKEFVENENDGLLPLPGVLPDMTAETESYINLQNIYRQQALCDADNVYRKCQTYLKELGMPPETITDKTVRLFCREAVGIALMRGSRIADESEKGGQLLSNDDMGSHGMLGEYLVALRAYERFLTECGHTPGECYVENDTSRLKTIATKMLADISDDVIHEICRYGGAELHSVSAFIGACAAHEVIKVITKQYKPLDNTFIYNGITTETATFKL